MESTGSQPTLSQQEAFARIRPLRSPNIGPVSYRQLLARFGTAGAALDALPDLANRGGRAYRPALLAELGSAPPILTCRGRLALASEHCVAVVGARNASAAAVKLARDFAAALAEAGFTVVSGLARGIDGAAHEGAFPQTIGVIASGIDIAYPPQHAKLQERIAGDGLLIAEQPPAQNRAGGTSPRATASSAGLPAARWWWRPRRNRAASSPRGWRARRGAR